MSFRAIYTDKHGNQELIKIPWYAAFGPTPRKVCRDPPPARPGALILTKSEIPAKDLHKV
jgi:hypothetical protein